MPMSVTPRGKGFSWLCSVSVVSHREGEGHSSWEKGTCSSFGDPEGVASGSPTVALAWEEHCELWSGLLQTFTMQVTLTWVPWLPWEASGGKHNVRG